MRSWRIVNLDALRAEKLEESEIALTGFMHRILENE